MSELKWCLFWPETGITGKLILAKKYDKDAFVVLGKYLSKNADEALDWLRETEIGYQPDRASFSEVAGGCGSCWRYACHEYPGLWKNLDLPSEMEFRWVVGNRNVTIIDSLGQRILSEKRFYE